MKVSIGQDSHRFELNKKEKPLILGGVIFKDELPMKANSDGDVILHAITNAISGITCKNVLGEVADNMCKTGITNSKAYIEKALEDLKNPIEHISISIEAKVPKFATKIEEMRESIAQILKIQKTQVGITATTGEELTSARKRRRHCCNMHFNSWRLKVNKYIRGKYKNGIYI